MYLYNVTIGIDKDAEQEWLAWMKAEHIPDVMGTGLFLSSRLYKVLHDSEDGTVSYSVQYFAATLENVISYLENFAPAMVEKHQQKYGGRHVAFRTLLEEV
ncbi:MAG: DUF4286 family protein [Cyclobacteriaceae bacterium]|nr:DUF4286 family protein [Cyclobacteriaceae bacterium]